MNKNTLKCRPVLVESKERSCICITSNEAFYYPNDNWFSKDSETTPQQLILISLDPDEKIEVGDVCYYENGLGGGKFLVISTKYGTYHELNVDPIKQYGIIEGGITPLKCEIFKVIATQSQLSPKYISKFIEQYNNGCVEDLEIEMEELYFHGSGYYKAEQLSVEERKRYSFMKEIKPKLTNGFITIVEKEPIIYTEDEVLEYCLIALKMGFDLNNNPLPRLNEISGKQYFKNWFENNKKK